MSHAKNPTVYRDTMALLQDLFNFKKPLAIGVHRQVKLWCPVKSRDLHIFMHKYTKTRGYLRLLKTGAPRYNVLGDVAGHVTREEAEIAGQSI